MVQNVMQGHDFFEGVRAGKYLFTKKQKPNIVFCLFIF